jgi:uncharacterized membrane protein
MRVDNRKILILIVVASLLLLPVAAFTSGALRIALGALCILFFPGYTLLSALFPRKSRVGSIERAALSFGLSIAVIPTLGLIINYTPWGLSTYPILISITLFIVVASAIGLYRQQALPPSERLAVTIDIRLSDWGKTTNLNKVISVSMGVVVLFALGSLGYIATMPKQVERFTEFYILGVDGEAASYSKQVGPGQPLEVIIGIVNHEHAATIYRVSVRMNGLEDKQFTTRAIVNGEKWEDKVSIAPQNLGKGQKVEFWLYKNDEDEACFSDPLRLYYDIVAPPSAP